MHVGMVTIDGEKMSKSLGNIRTIKHVLDNWGPNIIRLFCLSGHYSKPIDYSEELLKENLTKWRQAETCYYELIHANNANHDSKIKSIIEETSNEFDSALESDFNTHLALLAFFKLVKEINYLAAEEKLGSNDTKIIISEFERMLEILGLSIPKITSDEKLEINDLITSREQLRKEKKFQEADKIRDKLNEMNIELIDHRGKTIWIRKEKIKADVQ
ncbi:MAG: DALR domain-containing protein, partial [Nitrosarchaeum sp.]